MKKKIYWISGAVIVGLLIVCIIAGSCIGYIPVIGKYIADSKLSRYAGEPMHTNYDFYRNKYVVSDYGKLFQYELDTNTIFDESHNRNIEGQVKLKYHSFVKESSIDTIEYPSSISVSSKVDADDSSKVYVKIYCMTIFDDVEMSIEDSKKRICELTEQLVEYVGMNCTSLQIVYANKSGMFELVCDFGKNPIKYDELPKYIEQFEEDKLPLEYLEWRSSH